MKLSAGYQYTILCEDEKTKAFITNILVSQGINRHRISTDVAPSGTGSGEAYVRKQYKINLRAIRRFNYNARTLIVCTDADVHSLEERKLSFSNECSNVEPEIYDRTKKEPVIIWIPKRNIETWIEFFKHDGNGVNEEAQYKINNKNVKCKEEARKMSDFLQGKRDYKDYLSSLEDAYEEYENLCKVQMTKSAAASH